MVFRRFFRGFFVRVIFGDMACVFVTLVLLTSVALLLEAEALEDILAASGLTAAALFLELAGVAHRSELRRLLDAANLNMTPQRPDLAAEGAVVLRAKRNSMPNLIHCMWGLPS